MTTFDKEHQVQKDIAAVEKQKLALLEVKKEAYINYLKNKGNTPWIPGGAGAKHETSTHRSINRSAAEHRMQQKAWCRSPWPGQNSTQVCYGLNMSTVAHSSDLGREGDGALPYTPVSPSRLASRDSADQSVSASAQRAVGVRPKRSAVSPQRTRPAPVLPTASSADALRYSNDSGSFSGAPRTPGSVQSSQQYRNAATGARRSAASSVASSNSKYVALTVRLIDTAHASQKSSYGVFIVPRHCTRLEMLANIERQFNVHGQVSDVSITYRSGYSHGVTVSSLSMGTMADVPQLDDYSSITIYLNGATTFDSQGNVHTHPETAAGVAVQLQQEQGLTGEMEPVPVPSVLPGRTSAGGGTLRRPSGSDSASEVPSHGGTPDRVAQPGSGLSAGDNLLVYDDDDGAEDSETVDSAEVEEVVPYDGTSLQGSVQSRRSRVSATQALQSAQNPTQLRPVLAPTYAARHPDQPRHGFSYASPARTAAEVPSPSSQDGYYVRSSPATADQLRRAGSARSISVPVNGRPEERASGVRQQGSGYTGVFGLDDSLPSPPPQRQRRDWLGEAEARLREDSSQQSQLRSSTAYPHAENGDVRSSQPRRPEPVTSPAYRWGTASSLSRRRSRADLTEADGEPPLESGLRTRSFSADRSRSSAGRSAQLSLRSTASSRGRSAFINSRAAELQEVNLRLYGEARPGSPSARRRSNSVGRDARAVKPTQSARPVIAGQQQWDGDSRGRAYSQETFAIESPAGPLAGRSAYSSFRGGLGIYVHGKPFSRSSEELAEQDGLMAERSGTPLVDGYGQYASGVTYQYSADGVRAPTVFSQPALSSEGLLYGRYQHVTGQEDDRGRSESVVNAPGADGGNVLAGGAFNSADPTASHTRAGAPRLAPPSGADKAVRRQLSLSLEQLLEEAS
jgi:hypothetical protein